MASFNKVIILGNLGQDPQTRYMPNGNAVTDLSVATSEQRTDKATGEKKESVEWWRVTCFGRTAEVAAEFCKKGAPVLIEGHGRTEKWQAKDGTDRYTFKVIADRLVLLGSRNDSPSSTSSSGKRAAAAAPHEQRNSNPVSDIESDQIPF